MTHLKEAIFSANLKTKPAGRETQNVPLGKTFLLNQTQCGDSYHRDSGGANQYYEKL